MTDKVKVYELANELDIRSIELVDKLKSMSIDVKSHMSAISNEDAEKVRMLLGDKTKSSVASKDKKKKEEDDASKKTVIRRRKKVEEEVKAEQIAEKNVIKESEIESIGKSETTETSKKVDSVDKKGAQEEVLSADEILEEVIVAKTENKDEEDKKKKTQGLKFLDKEIEKEEDKIKEKKKTKSGKKEGKVEVVNILEMKQQASARVHYGSKKKMTGREQKKTLITTPKASKRKIKIYSETILITDLAKELSIKATEIIQKLFAMGTMFTINDSLDFDTATLIANEYSYELDFVGFEEKSIITTTEDKLEDMVPRPPVVTMMGHVDHGKTSILDAIRKTRVVDKEAGGITQHIGACEVNTPKGTITFIDTPGHEAFTEMRARGSKVTDIVVLVVAADDGLMPQTKESIAHCKAADVSIVVAVNKIDKAPDNFDKIRTQLSEYNLVPEDWGGETIFVKTSAIKEEGIEELLESILLQAEILELKANPDKKGEGSVIEARLDKGMGVVCSVIVQSGTLHVGDYIVAGSSYGKIKSIRNAFASVVNEIKPGFAGEILGLNTPPMAGDQFNCVSNEQDAKKLVQHRIDEIKRQDLVDGKKGFSLDDMMQSIKEGELKELKLLVKADTQGSVEALKSSLVALSDSEVSINIIHSSTGSVTVNDVNLALASEAIIVAFNVRPDAKAQIEADRSKMDIRYYTVIYKCLEEMELAKIAMLAPIEVEKINGKAEVRQLFSVSKIGVIAGCGVKDGKIIRNSMIRVIRDDVVIYTGKIKSLKHFKDDVKEVGLGHECGIGVEGYNDLKIGDILESFSIEKQIAVRPKQHESRTEL